MRKLKQLLFAAVMAFMPLLATVPVRAAEAPNWKLEAGSQINFSCGGGSYVHTVDTVVQGAGGDFTGTGHYNPDSSYTWDLSGNIAGDSFTFSILYTGSAFGSVYNVSNGTVNPDGSATADVDSNCQSLTMLDGSFTALEVLPTVEACEAFSNVLTTDLSTWDLTQTRSAGHNALVNDGLHIWTDTGAVGSPDPRKAAGYYATDFALSGLGDQTIDESLDYQATSGIEPGLQLVVDFDNDDTPDGILVGEAVYGNTWWLSNGSAQFVKDNAPNTGGGYGSNWFGTANEWLAEFSDAQVKAIGYSLGSGVDGDGVIKLISLGCVNYTFDLVVTNKEQCKNNGWMLGLADGRKFKNQGDCVSYFATKFRNPPSGN